MKARNIIFACLAVTSCTSHDFFYDQSFSISPDLTVAWGDLALAARSDNRVSHLHIQDVQGGVIADVCFLGESETLSLTIGDTQHFEAFLVFQESGIGWWEPGLSCEPPCSVFKAQSGTVELRAQVVQGYTEESYQEWQDGTGYCAQVDLDMYDVQFIDIENAQVEIEREHIPVADGTVVMRYYE